MLGNQESNVPNAGEKRKVDTVEFAVPVGRPTKRVKKTETQNSLKSEKEEIELKEGASELSEKDVQYIAARLIFTEQRLPIQFYFINKAENFEVQNLSNNGKLIIESGLHNPVDHCVFANSLLLSIHNGDAEQSAETTAVEEKREFNREDISKKFEKIIANEQKRIFLDGDLYGLLAYNLARDYLQNKPAAVTLIERVKNDVGKYVDDQELKSRLDLIVNYIDCLDLEALKKLAKAKQSLSNVPSLVGNFRSENLGRMPATPQKKRATSFRKGGAQMRRIRGLSFDGEGELEPSIPSSSSSVSTALRPVSKMPALLSDEQGKQSTASNSTPTAAATTGLRNFGGGTFSPVDSDKFPHFMRGEAILSVQADQRRTESALTGFSRHSIFAPVGTGSRNFESVSKRNSDSDFEGFDVHEVKLRSRSCVPTSAPVLQLEREVKGQEVEEVINSPVS